MERSANIQFPEMYDFGTPTNKPAAPQSNFMDPMAPRQIRNVAPRTTRISQKEEGYGGPPTIREVAPSPEYYNNRAKDDVFGKNNPLTQSMQVLPRASERRRDNNDQGGIGLDIKEDPSRKTVSRMKNSYGEELRKQMEDDKRKRRRSKDQDKEDDIHFLKESYNYNPFGRGGAGAPLRDQFGNMITSYKPFMRGDHERMHFRQFINRSDSRSSGRNSRNRARSSHPQRRGSERNVQKSYHIEPDDDNEPDKIAQGPISNTTAATAAQVANNEFFRPDYIVEYLPEKKKKVKQPRMPREEAMALQAPPPPPAITYQIVQPQVDWAAWRNELFALLQWERWQREEEEKRRKYQWMNEEEKYKNEREAMERAYQRELEDRRRQFVDIQQENLERMQDYWEHRHDEEMRRWEEMMAHPRYVQYLDKDNSVKLSQAFVDQLGSTMRLELDKLKQNMDGRDLELLKQIAVLKKDAADADRERFDSLSEVDRIRGELENQKALDGIRHKYVYNTLLWDKLMDHKMRYPECKPKYKDFDYSRRYAIEKSIVDSIPTVPDSEKLKIGDLDRERLKIEDINNKNDKYLAQTMNDKARLELDKLDSDLFSSKAPKTYRDAHDTYSRMGGLLTGNHQVNYN